MIFCIFDLFEKCIVVVDIYNLVNRKKMPSWLIEKDPLFAFEHKMSHFCNAIGCEGHSNPLRYVSADYPKRFYYIFKREELEEWFLSICRENRLICSYCENCYTCRSFHYIKKNF